MILKSIKISKEDYELVKAISEKEDGKDYYKILSRAIRNFAISKKILKI